MAAAFNPFRAGLAYLNTPYDLDRGGVKQKARNSFVCFAIKQAGERLGHEEQYLCTMAEAYIDMLIGSGDPDDSPTITKWLRANCPEFVAVEAVPNNHAFKYDLLQAYRWRWLNHMADQFDAGVIKLG